MIKVWYQMDIMRAFTRAEAQSFIREHADWYTGRGWYVVDINQLVVDSNGDVYPKPWEIENARPLKISDVNSYSNWR